MVDSSTSAWFKTVMDPAHARDYGASGIPDENKQPTAVCACKETFTVTEADASTVSSWYKASDWQKPSGTITVKSVRSVTVYSVATPFNLLIVFDAVVNDGSTDFDAFGTKVVYLSTDPASNSIRKSQRMVGASLTSDIVGQLMFTGGYYETGYVPTWTWMNGNSTAQYISLPVGSETQYATRTCNYKEGCYTVHRLNSYDWARVWRNGYVERAVGPSTAPAPYTIANLRIYDILNFNQGWDPVFVKYYTSGSTQWVMRVTYSYAFEEMRPFSQGGTDGAIFNRAAVDAYMTICDSVDFTYPASYNDLKQVINYVKRSINQNRSAIDTLVSSLPFGGTAKAALDLLLGWQKVPGTISIRQPRKRGTRRKGKGNSAKGTGAKGKTPAKTTA